MSDKRLFNLTYDQIRKQSGTRAEKCDYNTPIRKGETFEPCIRGGRKMLSDLEKKEMMRRIYRGEKKDGESLE